MDGVIEQGKGMAGISADDFGGDEEEGSRDANGQRADPVFKSAMGMAAAMRVGMGVDRSLRANMHEVILRREMGEAAGELRTEQGEAR
jgi:hypothetical protein